MLPDKSSRDKENVDESRCHEGYDTALTRERNRLLSRQNCVSGCDPSPGEE